MTYYLDTNILSYILAGKYDILGKALDIVEAGGTIKIPAVVYYEIKRGLYKATNKDKIRRFELVLENFDIEGMSLNTFMTSAQIYEDLAKDGLVIEDDDIFIGATAIENNAVLVTNNEKHFGRIKGLKIEIWL